MSFVRTKFSALSTSLHNTTSASNTKDYRDWLIQLIQSGIIDEGAVDTASTKYVAEHPHQCECIDSYRTMDSVTLPSGMSEAVANQMIESSVLLSEVNCVTLPFYSSLSVNECYVSVGWSHDDIHAKNNQRDNSAIFQEVPLKLTVAKSTLVESLRSENYTLFVQSLAPREIGTVVDCEILSRCFEFANRNTKEQITITNESDSRTTTICVSELDYDNPLFWEETVSARTDTTASNPTLVLGSVTATDLLSLRRNNGNPMVRYNEQDNECMLKGNRLLSVHDRALPYYKSADRGDCFGILADLSSITISFQVGMPLFLQPHSIRETTSSNSVDIVLYCDCQVMPTDGWMFLHKA